MRHELLERNKTDVNRYYSQLDVLNKEIQPKRPSLNTRKGVIKTRVDNNAHIRHIMLYHFEKGWKAAQSFCDLNELLRERTISESRCRELFASFESKDTSLEDKPGRCRSFNFADQTLFAVMEADESLTTRMLTDNLNVDYSTIVRRLKNLKMDPRELSDNNKAQRLRIFTDLF
uniref:HTH_48 domain-containing protein n=1 Tax=Glossina pallidipes TaxID=7398 RepID=A0A1A9Z232_GLOPL